MSLQDMKLRKVPVYMLVALGLSVCFIDIHFINGIITTILMYIVYRIRLVQLGDVLFLGILSFSIANFTYFMILLTIFTAVFSLIYRKAFPMIPAITLAYGIYALTC